MGGGAAVAVAVAVAVVPVPAPRAVDCGVTFDAVASVSVCCCYITSFIIIMTFVISRNFTLDESINFVHSITDRVTSAVAGVCMVLARG